MQPPGGPAAQPAPDRSTDVIVELDDVQLAGRLALPVNPLGVVVFAHGSGSSRFSPRNQQVAGILDAAGLGTLLFDLLSEAEAAHRRNVFDVELLGRRLHDTIGWLRTLPAAGAAPVALFGASTGAAVALWAAAQPDPVRGHGVRAVVSRGGRPDLAGPWLAAVRAPTLLIVGSRDRTVLQLNEEALAQLRCPSRLRVVPGAGHLFDEPGTLRAAALEAREWFLAHLDRDQI